MAPLLPQPVAGGPVATMAASGSPGAPTLEAWIHWRCHSAERGLEEPWEMKVVHCDISITLWLCQQFAIENGNL